MCFYQIIESGLMNALYESEERHHLFLMLYSKMVV